MISDTVSVTIGSAFRVNLLLDPFGFVNAVSLYSVSNEFVLISVIGGGTEEEVDGESFDAHRESECECVADGN